MNVTLDYIIGVGLQNPANYVAVVAAINLYEPAPPGQGLLTYLGLTIVSDVTMIAAGALHRTITLTPNAQGLLMYGTDPTKIKDATRNLFREALDLKTPGTVTAAEPVVS